MMWEDFTAVRRRMLNRAATAARGERESREDGAIVGCPVRRRAVLVLREKERELVLGLGSVAPLRILCPTFPRMTTL